MRLFKKVLLSGILLVSFLQLFSQENFVRVDLVGPIVYRKFGFGFEKSISTSRSLILNFDFNRYMKDQQSMNGQPAWTKTITGFSIFPEYRIYPLSNSFNMRPQGLFFGVYARYMKLFYEQNYDASFETQGYKDVTENAKIFGLGATTGYKYKKMDGRFYFEALLGLGWGYTSLKNFQYDFFPNESLLWRYELSVGYSF